MISALLMCVGMAGEPAYCLMWHVSVSLSAGHFSPLTFRAGSGHVVQLFVLLSCSSSATFPTHLNGQTSPQNRHTNPLILWNSFIRLFCMYGNTGGVWGREGGMNV